MSIKATIQAQQLIIDIVNDPNASSYELDDAETYASNHRMPSVLPFIAAHPNASPEQLSRMIDLPYRDVHLALASNPNLYPDDLEALLEKWGDLEVADLMLDNPKIDPHRVLPRLLAMAPIKTHLANPRLPKDYFIKYASAAHPDFKSEHLRNLRGWTCVTAGLKNPNITLDQIKDILFDKIRNEIIMLPVEIRPLTDAEADEIFKEAKRIRDEIYKKWESKARDEVANAEIMDADTVVIWIRACLLMQRHLDPKRFLPDDICEWNALKPFLVKNPHFGFEDSKKIYDEMAKRYGDSKVLKEAVFGDNPRVPLEYAAANDLMGLHPHGVHSEETPLPITHINCPESVRWEGVKKILESGKREESDMIDVALALKVTADPDLIAYAVEKSGDNAMILYTAACSPVVSNETLNEIAAKQADGVEEVAKEAIEVRKIRAARTQDEWMALVNQNEIDPVLAISNPWTPKSEAERLVAEESEKANKRGYDPLPVIQAYLRRTDITQEDLRRYKSKIESFPRAFSWLLYRMADMPDWAPRLDVEAQLELIKSGNAKDKDIDKVIKILVEEDRGMLDFRSEVMAVVSEWEKAEKTSQSSLDKA
jgi:hypothetical protein